MIAKSRGAINGFSRSENVIYVTELSFKLSDVKESWDSCLFRSVRVSVMRHRTTGNYYWKKPKPKPNEFMEKLISSSPEF